MLPNDDVVRSAMLDALVHAGTGVLCVKCCVGLSQLPFVPDPTGAMPTGFEPTFTGYGPIERVAVDAQIVSDPVTGRVTVFIPPPAGGWKFVATADLTPTVTIYGFYFTVGVEDTDPQFPVTGSELFDTPITLTTDGEFVNVDQVKFELVAPYMV